MRTCYVCIPFLQVVLHYTWDKTKQAKPPPAFVHINIVCLYIGYTHNSVTLIVLY